MRIHLLLALTLSLISIATGTQAQESQDTNKQIVLPTRIPQSAGRRRILNSPLNLGILALRQRRYSEAEDIFRGILQDNPPEEYKIHTYLGFAIYHQATRRSLRGARRRNIADAVSQFLKAKAESPSGNYYYALDGLSRSYEFQGDRFMRNQRSPNLDRAIERYQEANKVLRDMPSDDNVFILPLAGISRPGAGLFRPSVEHRVREINSKLASAYVRQGDRKEDRNPEGALQDYQQAFNSLGLRRGYRFGEYCREPQFSSPGTRPFESSSFTTNRLSSNRRPLNLNARLSGGNLPAQLERSQVTTSANLRTEITSKLAKALTSRGDRRSTTDISAASVDYCEATRINSNHAPAYFKLGNIFSRQGNQQQAIEKYQEAINANAQYLEAYVALAEAFEAQGDQVNAGATYIKIFQIAPDTPDIVSKLPREQLETLAAYFRHQLRVDSNNAHEHYYHLGRISSWREDFEGAIDYFDHSINSPSRVISFQGTRIPFGSRLDDAYRLRGLALSAQGKYLQAIESLERAIERRPNDATGHYSLGEVLVQQGVDLQRAMDSYRKAIALDADDNYAEAYNALGQLLAMQGDDESAGRYFFAAIDRDNQYAEPHNNLGKVYERSQLFDHAIYYYKQAEDISGYNYPEARDNRVNAQSRVNEWLLSQGEDFYWGPIGDTDWFWLDWDDSDEDSILKRSVVRIVPRQGGIRGTGWVVKQENNSLWIVTNCHVIEDKGDIDAQFFSTLPAGRTYLKLPATVVESSCGRNEVDLALLKVDDAPDIPPLEIAPASLSSSSSLVRIVGHPSISDDWTIVSGSANRNNIWTDDDWNQDRDHLQIDATVGTGNSGGPVLNDQNQVVGIMHVSTGVDRDSAATGGFAGAYSVSALRTTLGNWGLDLQ